MIHKQMNEISHLESQGEQDVGDDDDDDDDNNNNKDSKCCNNTQHVKSAEVNLM
jgi:hypothetical protein